MDHTHIIELSNRMAIQLDKAIKHLETLNNATNNNTSDKNGKTIKPDILPLHSILNMLSKLYEYKMKIKHEIEALKMQRLQDSEEREGLIDTLIQKIKQASAQGAGKD